MNKEEKYGHLRQQVAALCEGESDLIAKMANVSALLHQEFGFWWTGFYRVAPACGVIQKSKDNIGLMDYSEAGRYELVLGPFQGPLACVHIGYGKGVCGTAWKERRTVVVPDVEQFPGHIACSSESRSEIVVPVFQDEEVIAVLDIDSRDLNTFDEVDARWLERIAARLVTTNAYSLTTV